MVKLTKIYTRTGDKGQTGLVSSDRVAKTSARIAAIGSVDELNAAIGVVLSALDDQSPLLPLLSHIQNDLFDLGADIATPEENEHALRIAPSQTAWLEQQIDALNDALPVLNSFILPAGLGATSHLHLARAIARRAERDVWCIAEELAAGELLSDEVAIYLNRLSDFLFVAARTEARNHDEEVLWKPGENR